jgi:hypothetical protein
MTRRFPLIILAVAIFAHAGPALGQMPEPTQEFMTADITGITSYSYNGSISYNWFR